MSIWTLAQIVFDLMMLTGMLAMWMRLRRPPQDDPRLSRGLQLLQTKITVLEDLSDRTDAQVKTLSTLLDQKNRMLQNKILEAEQQVLKIDHSMEKSMEVAEIFQDKIPHKEIMERQRTVEYVKAARMAHSGLAVDEIAASVALPREQIELIAKFNREQLMFDESALPGWVNKATDGSDGHSESGFELGDIDFVGNIERPTPDFQQMAKIGADFKEAVKVAREIEATPMPTLLDNKVADTLRAGMQGVGQGMTQGMQVMGQGMQAMGQGMQPAVMSMKATAQTLREKLVSTAEDLLKAQSQPAATTSFSSKPTAPPSSTYSSAALPSQNRIIRSPEAGGTKIESAEIKKVMFPKIDR